MNAPAAELPRTRPSRLRLALSVLVVAAAAVGTLPDLLGLDARSPFAQLVAFRPALLAGVLVFGVVAAVAAGLRRAGRTLAAGLLGVGLVGSVVVLPRAVPDSLATPGAARTLTVLAFNTYEGEADVAAFAALIRDTRPDVVALIEVGGRYRDRLAPLVPEYRFRASQEDGPDVQGVTAAVHEDLADPDVSPVAARVDRSTDFPSVELTGGGLGDVRFVAFHSVAPVPGQVPQWRHDLGTLARWCANRDAGRVIIAGDFNATLDHSVFRDATQGCADAAAAAGGGLAGTWPTTLPRPLGAQIDHVLVTGDVAVATFAVHDLPGSDHRAVLTRLLL